MGTKLKTYLKSANVDLKVAKLCLKTYKKTKQKEYLVYVKFATQQCIEKSLKHCIEKRFGSCNNCVHSIAKQLEICRMLHIPVEIDHKIVDYASYFEVWVTNDMYEYSEADDVSLLEDILDCAGRLYKASKDYKGGR